MKPGPSVVVVALMLLASASVTAAQVEQRPPHRQVQTNCAPCSAVAAEANRSLDGLQFLWDRKQSVEKSIAIVERITAERAETIARMEAAIPPSGRTRQQHSALDTLKDVNAGQRSGLDRKRRQLAEIDRQIVEQNDRIATLLRRLHECEAKCTTPPATEPPAADPPPPPPPPTATTMVARCPACQRYADLYQELEEERLELLAEFDRIELEIGVMLSGLSAGRPIKVGGIGPVTLRGVSDDPLGDAEDALDEVSDDIDDIDREIYTAWMALTNCLIACTQTTTSWMRPQVYGPIGGGILLGGLLFTGGDGSPAATTLPPITATPTIVTPSTPTPTPTPTPAPVPTPAVASPAGTHNTTGCSVAEDRANHDPTLQACVRLLQFIITSPTAGAMVVLGASPFSAMTGSYSTSSGEFDLTTVAIVAGFSGVQIRFRGVIDATGDITSATLTFGDTGGLPRDTRIVYAFTTRRNR